jgi:hypothetical protein
MIYKIQNHRRTQITEKRQVRFSSLTTPKRHHGQNSEAVTTTNNRQQWSLWAETTYPNTYNSQVNKTTQQVGSRTKHTSAYTHLASSAGFVVVVFCFGCCGEASTVQRPTACCCTQAWTTLRQGVKLLICTNNNDNTTSTTTRLPRQRRLQQLPDFNDSKE